MSVERVLAFVFARERRPVLASLARRFDLGIAEEAVDQAIEAAVVRFREGVPEEPGAWLQKTATHKAIDIARHAAIRARYRRDVAAFEERERDDDRTFPDDQLRLIFTCCHPALEDDAKVALALRMLSGLSTEEVARAFLVSGATMAQRLVRAKSKIRDAKIPYEIPEMRELPARIEGVVTVLYLVFNEGYVATRGALTRADLATEAIRLAELLAALLPEQALPRALLALMLFIDARRDARTTRGGEIVLLEHQDRALWDRDKIDRGRRMLQDALQKGPPSTYAVEAAIAGLHDEAKSFEETDFRQIVHLYGILFAKIPSPIVALNAAVARSMCDGPKAALREVDDLVARGELLDNHLLWATRADLLRRSGRGRQARADYERALGLAKNEAERRFLERRIREVS